MSRPVGAGHRVGAGIAGAAALIAIITAVSRVVGFGRWVVFDRTVGNACVGNIYAAANQVPNVLYEVVAGGALAAAVVPVVAPMISREATDDVRRTISALLTWALVVTLPLAALLVVLAGPLARVLTPANCTAAQGEAAADLTAWMLRVFAAQVVLYAIGMVASSALQAHRRFLWPAMAPLLSSLVVIVSYLFVSVTITGHRNDPRGLPQAAADWLAWGTTVGVVALSLPLLLPLLRVVPGLRPSLAFPVGAARAVVGQAGGGVVALLAQQAFVVTVLALTSRHEAPVGSLNLFQYTQAVYLLPFSVLVIPLVTSVFPALSGTTEDRVRFGELSARTLRTTVVVALAGTVALVAAAPALEVFFGRLDGSRQGAHGMGLAVVMMALGLPGFTMVTQAGRALQALRCPGPAAAGTSLAWIAAAGGAVVLVLAGGVAPLTAICAGSALGMSAGAVALLWSLIREAGPESLDGLVRVTVIGTAMAVVAGGLGWLICNAVTSRNHSAGVAVVIGTVAAGLAALPLAVILVELEPQVRQRLPKALRRGRWS